MKSFSILRTHTGLTTNVKVMVDSNYNLYLESINSVPDLDLDRFKKMQFNKSNYYDELVPYFFKNFPVDIAFSIKYESDNDNMSVDFANQYDDIYLAGARNIIDNKNYTEEYEYFAPLYVFKHALPKYFVIFRIDGPGLLNMTKDNFRQEFLNKFKTVKLFDLTKKSLLGEWMDNNFSNNPNFPVTGLEVDFNELEFSKWTGIDYDSGGYTYKSFYLEENLENENNLFDFEKLFLDGYRVNKVIFPHIINFSYLFDDTPATPTSLRKWSLNRYAGFYLDEIELIDTVTPFIMPELQPDVVIYGSTGSNTIASTTFGDPFKNGWRNDVDMWIEYLGEFYKVIKVEETLEKAVTAQNIGSASKKVLVDTVGKPVVTKYKIVSDLNLTGKQSLLNKRSCYINSLNQIVKTDGSPYTISNFTFADVNMIDIDGKYHNIILENGYLTLVTDYGFKFQEKNTFEYYINSGATGFSNKIDLFITNLNSPKNFKIYRAKFTDVKDFDTFIVDTEFSKFEYEKRNDLTKTEETKMYLTDLRSKSSPQDFDDFIFGGKTELIPVASDYTANLETFRIEDKKLTDLWRKNPIYCRWGYQNSRSAHDYPYLLNNNDVHEKWNRTVDTQNLKPERSTRNLDYFYTMNSGTTSYLHHSLHIEKNYGTVQDTSFRFELDKYLELGSYSFTGLSYSYDFSYFDLIFAPTQSFIDGELVLNKKKYSWFDQGDNVIPNTTVFRGLKFRLFEVDTIKYNSTFIENINLVPSNFFNDYKFSILLSSNDWMVNFGDSQTLYKPYYWDYFIDTQNEGGNLALLTSYATFSSSVDIGDMIEIDQFYPYTVKTYQATASNVISTGNLVSGGFGIKLDKTYQGSSLIEPGIWRNKMQWQVINKWEHDVSYTDGDLVIYEDIVFIVTNGATVSDPSLNPVNLTSNYSVGTSFTQFWNYNTTYNSGDWVYRFEQYYEYNSLGTIDFWNPNFSYTTPGTKVMYYDRFFESVNPSLGIHPNLYLGGIGETQSFWKELEYTSNFNLSIWKPIQLWNKNQISYVNNNYVVNDDILFRATQNTISEDIPGISTKWQRIYNFIPQTDYLYSSILNSVILINDSYYYCLHNPGQNNPECSLLCFCNGRAYTQEGTEEIKNLITGEGFVGLPNPEVGIEGRDWFLTDEGGNIVDSEARQSEQYSGVDFDTMTWTFEEEAGCCKLKFKNQEQPIPSTTDVFAILDTTSLGLGDGVQAKNNLIEWFAKFCYDTPNHVGNLYIIPSYISGCIKTTANSTSPLHPNNMYLETKPLDSGIQSAERWLACAELIWNGKLDIRGKISSNLNWSPFALKVTAVDARNSWNPQTNSVNSSPELPLQNLTGGTGLDTLQSFIPLWQGLGFQDPNSWTPPQNVIIVNFMDESSQVYHGNAPTYNTTNFGSSLSPQDPQPTKYFKRDYWAFTRDSTLSPSSLSGTQPNYTDGGFYNKFSYFKAVLYPVVRNSQEGGGYPCTNLVLQGLASIKGTTITQTQIDSSIVNGQIDTTNEFAGLCVRDSNGLFLLSPPISSDYRIDVHLITTQNPYITLVDNNNQPGLEQFGWKGKWDKRANGYTGIPVPGYNAWDSLPNDLNQLFVNVNQQAPQTFYLLVNFPEADAGVCSGDLTLDSGITIYINKKWKNVLVNITINDNTITSDSTIMDETRNLERDSLYVLTNGRLTTANFIRQLNDLDKLYGFVDYTSYVVIEEDGRFKRFNFKNDLDKLPYLMICEEPDAFELKNDSLRYKINTVDKNVLKPSRYLVNGQLDNLEKIDFYNDLPLGVEIQNVKSDLPVLKNYNNQRSIIFEKYFRHSGYYMPIFYEVELFTNADLYDTGRLCEAQFVLSVDNNSVECPILTWKFRFIQGEDGPFQILIPFLYTGQFNATYSYQSQLFDQDVYLRWNSNQWQVLFGSTLTVVATASSLLGNYQSNEEGGTYSIMTCGYTQSYCVKYTPTSTGTLLTVPTYPIIYESNSELIGYYVSGEGSITWNSGANAWTAQLEDQNGNECSSNIGNNQNVFPVGTYTSNCGTIVISDFFDCLNEWLPEGTQFQSGQTQVTFYFEAGDLNSTQTISIAAPVSNTPQAWEDFYQQVIDVIQQQDIFSDKVLSFEIYEPGNDNIHPQITEGYYVLSVKYDSPVCNLRLKATGPSEITKTYCLTIRLKSFSFSNRYIVGGELASQTSSLGNFNAFILQLIPGPFENNQPTYGAWCAYTNQYFAFKVYYTGTRWEIMRYLNGSSQIVFYSNTFEGLFTANLTNIDFASISEGSCNSVCVSVVFNEDIPVTRTGTFMLVDALYNGKKYYAGTIDGILYLIVWENASPAGWYLKDPNPSGGVIGYVTNTSEPLGTWIPDSPFYEISSQPNVCPAEGEVYQLLNSGYGIPSWILNP